MTRAPDRAIARPIRTLFVANRGEIAARIARTTRQMGRTPILPHARGGGLDLLDGGAVIAAALASGSDAVHPGYGFLSENAEFAEAVEAAGLLWVGPPAPAIRAMGDKAAARRLASSLGVPTVPGYDGEEQSDDRLAAEAARIGYPVLVKPAGGGGGKGMREVREAGELQPALAGARREAAAAFGDDRLILERLLVGPRHLEVQVLFDGQGAGVELGERDCSLQRRHQKVLEETPSPAADPELRAGLGAAALRLATSVRYRSAGTVEFLVDEAGAFYFLEMNTRLQVEHPVTELVTGRDLVADQLRIAEGSSLGELPGPDRSMRGTHEPFGHAVEVRLYAEDPEAGFLPSTGRVERLDWPAAEAFEGLRIDSGIEPGSEIGGRFDPLLAKIIVGGGDRDEAFDRLTAALERTVVLGLTTNLRFLRWLVRHPTVRAGDARVDTIDRIWGPAERSVVVPEEAWKTAGHSLLGYEGSSTPDPWAGGWRLNASPKVRLTDGELETAVELDPGGRDGSPAGERPDEPAFVLAGDVAHVDVEGRSVAIRLAPSPDVEHGWRPRAAHNGGLGSAVVAPMPGNVLAVHVEPGRSVDAGDPIATLEAMKMEHVVTATGAGRVTDVLVSPGDQVGRGQLIALVEGS